MLKCLLQGKDVYLNIKRYWRAIPLIINSRACIESQGHIRCGLVNLYRFSKLVNDDQIRAGIVANIERIEKAFNKMRG